jgi:hypothetical protein
VNQLVELQLSAADFMRRDGREAMDSFFFAEQNARLVKNVEQYYRLMFMDASRRGICATAIWPKHSMH